MGTVAHSRKREKGQAALEGALVTLVFLVTLIGIVDLGQVLFVRQTFTARVRSAARYAVVNPNDTEAIRNMVLYGQTSAGSGSGVFGLAAGMVQVTQADTGTSAARIIVTISGYQYRIFSPWIGQAFTGRPVTASFPIEAP